MPHLITLYECGGAQFAAIHDTDTGERVLACLAEPDDCEPMPDAMGEYCPHCDATNPPDYERCACCGAWAHETEGR